MVWYRSFNLQVTVTGILVVATAVGVVAYHENKQAETLATYKEERYCLEGYLDEIVDSVSYSAGRELTDDEQQAIFVFVSEAIEKATGGTEMETGQA